MVLRNQHENFGGKLTKVGVGAQNFNAGFVKQHCTLFSFLIYAIKDNVEKKFKTCYIFWRDCFGEVSRKTLFKTNKNILLFFKAKSCLDLITFIFICSIP